MDKLTDTVGNLPTFTMDKLNQALYHLVDITDRLAVPFLLLGETARSILEDNELKGDGVEIGVRKAEWNEQVQSTLRTLASNAGFTVGIKDFEWVKDGCTWTYQGVPIHIKVIERRYGFIQNPNYAFYWGEMYNLPNPFEKYWKGRYLVK